MKIVLSRSLYLSITLGVAYGISMRIFVDSLATGVSSSLVQGLVSISFFVLVPVVIGFVTVFSAEPHRTRSLKWAFFAPWVAIGAFLLASVVLLLEGSICVVIALPAFLLLASAGGILASWVARARANRAQTLCLAILAPIIASPIEGLAPIPNRSDSVSTSIRINAPAETVWAEITDVSTISEDELSFGLGRLMGMPQPIEAHMEDTTDGLVRNTRWDRGVKFREIITDSVESRSLTWDFDFPPSAVPEGVLDDHVMIGGSYFELLDGGYRIEPQLDGSVVLSLETGYRVSARPSSYAQLWAHVILDDFHRVILDLIRDRSEVHGA